MTEIEKTIKDILAERLNIDIKNINSHSKLVEDLGMDSFGAVELMFEIEDKMGIEIPEKDILTLITVEDVILYISSRILKKEGNKIHFHPKRIIT